MTAPSQFAIIFAMKMLDICWVKNSRVKNCRDFKKVDRAPWNEYPVGTATVELVRVRADTPDVKIHFHFPSKQGMAFGLWDDKKQSYAENLVSWSFKCTANLMFNKVENDYDCHFNFFLGKYNTPKVNNKEMIEMVEVIQLVKKDLKNLLTVNNFS